MSNSYDTPSMELKERVQGIHYVRPPVLTFEKGKPKNDMTPYTITTYKDLDEKPETNDNPFISSSDSFIYCNPTLKINMPHKKYMIRKDGSKRFAYVIAMFPNPKNYKPAYLDGCILAALGLRRQQTNADIICMLTPDISDEVVKQLENIHIPPNPNLTRDENNDRSGFLFDEVVIVPYISPYDMKKKYKDYMRKEGDKSEDKDFGWSDTSLDGRSLDTIRINDKLFENCPNYDENHPYVHVFFKLHIFNQKLFKSLGKDYEKVCFVDSDLVPLNFYDSLFTLDCPAGFVEYRKKTPYLESYQWDRCDFLEHGQPIPKALTDVDKKTGADVNAGLLLVEPNMKEYNSMISELETNFMGDNKEHSGFWSFDFDSSNGQKFVNNSYCYPEQNYLTKRYSGKWKFIEFAFQSWALDPCNSFGIHMAAFNPKPWIIQPLSAKLKIKHNSQPYMTREIDVPITLKENTKENYENISYSYEIFNEVILWGLVNYSNLSSFFMNTTKIAGKKTSFDLNKFENISNGTKELLLKDIKKEGKYSGVYKRLSKTQKFISDLLDDNQETKQKLLKAIPQLCKARVDAEGDNDTTIIEYDYGKQEGGAKKKSQRRRRSQRRGSAKRRGPSQRRGRSQRRRGRSQRRRVSSSKRRVQRIPDSEKHIFYYFSMNGCKYCKEFDPVWKKITTSQSKKQSPIIMKKIIQSRYSPLLLKYNIQSFPTLLLQRTDGSKSHHIFEGDRTMKNINDFIKDKTK
jgi:hypothetical protein